MLFSSVSVLVLLCAAQFSGTTALKTFQDEDPDTGLPVVCDRCPPGSYLRAPCTSKQKSECAPCPSGSFTELWNHIDKCLRCGICGHNQVVKTQCSAQQDCECECKQGYYLKKKYDLCVRYSDCPSGHGVLSNGTAEQDTVCQVCPSGSYSDRVSAQQSCTAHSNCSASGQRLVLKGSAWHDSVCATCEGNKTHDGADYLREILPAFFVHQKMIIKRLRRLANKLPLKNGEKPNENIARLHRGELNALIDAWVGAAAAEQLRQLPGKLRKIGAGSAADKLENKLQRIDSELTEPCAVVEAE
ncbi:tumor necrosis factor receptor superfamily member 6B [Centroberyx gerrardi]